MSRDGNFSKLLRVRPLLITIILLTELSNYHIRSRFACYRPHSAKELFWDSVAKSEEKIYKREREHMTQSPVYTWFDKVIRKSLLLLNSFTNTAQKPFFSAKECSYDTVWWRRLFDDDHCGRSLFFAQISTFYY